MWFILFLCPNCATSKPQIVPHPRIEGLFVGNGTNALYTKNLVPGESHNDEILLPVENDDGTRVEYREWNPSRSKLAVAILCGAHNIWIKPGSRVLYLGFACGTTISHISDLVGPEGIVYVVESKNGENLMKMAEKRFNIVPVIETSLLACKYRMLVDMVDVMFAAVDNPQQAQAPSVNAKNFLKAGGHYVIYAKASLGEDVFAHVVRKPREFMPKERIALKPFEEDHAYVIGVFRMLESSS